MTDLAILAAWANRVGAESTRGPAPALSPESGAVGLCAWLRWNDRNGDYYPVVSLHLHPNAACRCGVKVAYGVHYDNGSGVSVPYCLECWEESNPPALTTDDAWDLIADMAREDGAL